MKVIYEEPQSWFLLQDGDDLFLDVYCNSSFVGFERLIQLNSEEMQRYRDEGRAFLQAFAQDIQYFALTNYRSRHMTGEIDTRVTEAVREYHSIKH